MKKNFKTLVIGMIASFILIPLVHSQTDSRGAPELHPVEETAKILSRFFKQQNDFEDYSSLTDQEFYSVNVHSGGYLEVMYKPKDYQGNLEVDDVDVGSRSFISAKQIVLNIINRSESVELTEDEEDPFLFVKTTDYSIIRDLRKSEYVEYVGLVGIQGTATPSRDNGSRLTDPIEKMFYNDLTNNLQRNNTGLAGVGCKNEAAPSNGIKVYTGPNGESIPWHYKEMGIECANTVSTGRGIKVALLDSGISKDQVRLSSAGFKKSYSGRSISTKNILPPGIPQCGHGTHMAGAIGAPVYDSAIRGVAYEADLLNVNCSQDVVIDQPAEILAISLALKRIRKSKSGYSGVKIVSMSLAGLPSLLIKTQLSKARKAGILVFSAAGTTPESLPKDFSFFPSYLSTTVSVTGVYEGFPNKVAQNCDRCHYSKTVDFVVPMQRGKDSDDYLTHSLTMDNAKPSNVGGSSIATATMAGVAALIWAMPEHKNKNAQQIINLMVQNASYPSARDPHFGWGVVDVSKIIECSSSTDPCDGVTCPPGLECVNGICKSPKDCEGVICPPGFYCLNGDCVRELNKECERDAQCPIGYECEKGICMPIIEQ